jgi:hypothetical protein
MRATGHKLNYIYVQTDIISPACVHLTHLVEPGTSGDNEMTAYCGTKLWHDVYWNSPTASTPHHPHPQITGSSCNNCFFLAAQKNFPPHRPSVIVLTLQCRADDTGMLRDKPTEQKTDETDRLRMFTTSLLMKSVWGLKILWKLGTTAMCTLRLSCRGVQHNLALLPDRILLLTFS